MNRLWLTAGLLLGCAPEADPRPQWLLHIDTNLAAADQQFERPELGAAVVDTVRIDVLAPVKEDPREYAVLRHDEWPLSIGIVPSGQLHVLRIRAFHAREATPIEVDGRRQLEPHPSATVDRLVVLDGTPNGVEERHVVLDADCLNRLTQFTDEPTTCVDAERLSVAPSEGIGFVESRPSSLTGTWSSLREQACGSPVVDDRVCIPGGFSMLGEQSLVGFISSALYVEPVPLRPVLMSAFRIDRQEFTVGRFRALVREGRVTSALPKPVDDTHPFDVFCTWRGERDDENDALPLNGVSRTTAREACALVGGELPTEAQWEFVARGRGRMRLFPWGDHTPTCCQVSANRGSLCPGGGVSPVGQFADGCGGGDVTIDGVWDLGGNVNELVEGWLAPYGDPCWGGRGVSRDPLCASVPGEFVGVRGGDFASGLVLTASALRTRDIVEPNPSTGFRCVYLEGA